MKILYNLACNPNMDFSDYNDIQEVKQEYLSMSKKQLEVPMLIIPTLEDVKFNGDFDFVV